MVVQIDKSTYSINGIILTENDIYEAYRFVRNRNDKDDVKYCLCNNYTQEKAERIIASDLFYDILGEFKDNKDRSEDWLDCCEAAIDYYKYDIEAFLNEEE